MRIKEMIKLAEENKPLIESLGEVLGRRKRYIKDGLNGIKSVDYLEEVGLLKKHDE